MGKSNNRKKRSASGVSYSSKKSPSDNHDSKGTEDLSKGRDEKEYKISTILDDWKKIVGFYAACIAVISAFNIVLWSLFSSGFKLEVGAYLLAHGMGGGAILFQPIVIMQIIVVLSSIVGAWLKNNRKYIFLYNDSKLQIFLHMIIVASFIALAVLFLAMFQSTYNIFSEGRLQLSLVPAVVLICDIVIEAVAIIGLSVTVATSEKIKNSVKEAKENRNNTIVGFCVLALLFSIASILPPSIMYYKGYGVECFEISKSSVSDRVLGSISENNLTDDQKNKIRESLGESWSVRGEEGERFSIFVTREDKDTIDGVLFKKDGEDLRSKGKVVTINRKAIKTRDVCHQ